MKFEFKFSQSQNKIIITELKAQNKRAEVYKNLTKKFNIHN